MSLQAKDYSCIINNYNPCPYRTLYGLYIVPVLVRFTRRARGHFMMLIESGMHLYIECNAGHTYLRLLYDQEIHLFDPNVNVLNVV